MSPKLRASCDACHSAKIKCIKTDTGCQRCDNSAGELAYKYSPLLPRIYHKKSNRDQVEVSQPNRSGDALLLHDSYGSQASLGQDVYPAVVASPSAFDQQTYGIGVDAEPDSFFWQYLPQSSMGVSQNANLWPSSIVATPTTNSTPSLTNAATTPATVTSTTSVLPASNQSRVTNTQKFMHYHSASSPTSSLERVFARTPCNCFTHLLEAMQRMNAHTTSRSPKLDVVLCANQAAAKHCLTSLRCSHPSRTVRHDSLSSCATIACGLLDRILASYQAALEIFHESLDCENVTGLQEHGDDMVGGHGDDEDERMTARTTTVQLRIGSYALEKSEQIIWAKQIVAREVGKIQETLTGFEVESQGVQTVLLNSLLQRCKTMIAEVSGS